MRARSLFAGKVAVVIGASSGIGQAFARVVAEHGARVIAASRNAAALERLCAEIGPEARAESVDVRQRESVRSMIRNVAAREGRLDILYNGAGVGLLATLEDTEDRHWDDVLSTNLLGVVHGMQAAYPIMQAQGSGHILNVASLAGLLPLPASAAYAAAKYGVVGLSHSARIDAARHGVAVSVVCPAAVDTPIFVESSFVNFDMKKVLASRPGSVLSAEECAHRILRGMRRNAATIAPGPAGPLWLLYRHAPWLWDLAARHLAKSLESARRAPAGPIQAEGPSVK
ncbi:MAG: SDR family oxidoreductase [Sandaracinaceae bacterium]|nr:SDR family oxidoreductase [Sandaracinaceae bacterium]